MLEEHKKIYMQEADLIPDWRKQSKSDLIRHYCKIKDTDDKLKNAYLAAIMCKYWGVLTNYYRQPHSCRIYKEDCYDWFTQAVLHITDNPNLFNDEYLYLTYKKTGDVRVRKNTIYGKEDAPNIAMIKCLSSMKLGFYQSANYDNRKINYDIDSLDGILEEKHDGALPQDRKSTDFLDDAWYKDILRSVFKSKAYNDAFVLEGILNGNVFEKSKETQTLEFSKKKLAKHLRHIDPNYCSILAKEYNLDENTILEASKPFTKYGTNEMYKNIDKALKSLKYTLSPEMEPELGVC